MKRMPTGEVDADEPQPNFHLKPDRSLSPTSDFGSASQPRYGGPTEEMKQLAVLVHGPIAALCPYLSSGLNYWNNYNIEIYGRVHD